jgi:regulatory protein
VAGRKGASAAPPPSAYQRALARLSRRDHTESELRRRLAEAGHPEDAVDAALARLRAQGYVDDAGFAARFARSRLANRGLGRHRIRQALHRRGVARPTAEAGLTAATTEVSEAAVLEGLARRYWQQHTRDEPAQRLRKLATFLVRRGFPVGLVFDRLHALWPRWGDALEGLAPLDELGMDETDIAIAVEEAAARMTLRRKG